jgi:hypothetical protein
MLRQQQQKQDNLLKLSEKHWSRYLKLPKQKKRMSILRNGSMLSARKLRKL